MVFLYDVPVIAKEILDFKVLTLETEVEEIITKFRFSKSFNVRKEAFQKFKSDKFNQNILNS